MFAEEEEEEEVPALEGSVVVVVEGNDICARGKGEGDDFEAVSLSFGMPSGVASKESGVDKREREEPEFMMELSTRWRGGVDFPFLFPDPILGLGFSVLPEMAARSTCSFGILASCGP